MLTNWGINYEKDFAKYRQFGDNIPNLYIYGHPHKGIVYIIENLNREKKE